jgi:hypothetical protein
VLKALETRTGTKEWYSGVKGTINGKSRIFMKLNQLVQYPLYRETPAIDIYSFETR